MAKIPDSVLNKMSGQPNANGYNSETDIIEQQKRQVDKATNPNFVTDKKGWYYSPENRMRRRAVQEALEARLAIFRDNIEAIRTANRVMNNAAIVQVMVAAENFIVQIRGEAEVEKADILNRAQEGLMQVLSNHLAQLEKMRQQSHLPDELIEARITMAYNEFGDRALKIAGLDFEFDKSKLLQLA